MARSRWIAIAVMSATFLAGAMAGAATLRLLAEDRPAEPRRDRPDGRRAEPGERPSIFDRIGLTPEQKAAVDSVIEKRNRDLSAFWTENGPLLRAIADSTRAEIDRLLTPEQRQKLEEFRQRRWRDHGNSDGGNGPGPRPGPGDSAKRPVISYFEPRSI
jgi:Spy/CpxP family protein refolding chaperone